MKEYKVKSSTDPNKIYSVIESDNKFVCSCPATTECRHIKQIKRQLSGETEEEIELLVCSPYLQTLRTEGARIVFDLLGDGKEGIPQLDAINQVLSWKNCEIVIKCSIKK